MNSLSFFDQVEALFMEVWPLVKSFLPLLWGSAFLGTAAYAVRLVGRVGVRRSYCNPGDFEGLQDEQDYGYRSPYWWRFGRRPLTKKQKFLLTHYGGL